MRFDRRPAACFALRTTSLAIFHLDARWVQGICVNLDFFDFLCAAAP